MGMSLILRFLPHATVLAIIASTYFYVQSLSETVGEQANKIKEDKVKIEALNASVSKLATENQANIKKLASFMDYSDKMQKEALQVSSDNDNDKQQLQTEITNLYNKLRSGEKDEETCTFSVMPAHIIDRLRQRSTAASNNRESDIHQNSPTATPH